MKQLFAILFATGLTAAAFAQAKGQERKWEDIDTSGYYQKKIIKRGGYELTFISQDSTFNPETGRRMIELFFKVYPAEVRRFNHQSAKNVTFVISKDYKGIAATEKAFIKYDPGWLKRNPEDIDCATHELMHVVQVYQGADNPGWLVEGIADYARYIYGVNNDNGRWRLPDYRQGQLYTDAYRVTARFLIWMEKHYNKDLVNKLDHAIRQEKYTPGFWIKSTGKSLDELWYLYGVSPAFS